ncbi:MAG: DUF2795 domain-containing protein [Chloroflexi bacterium]|nr:DUF2795 domain-containing protein [Chloroflexota bacterium]
MTMGSAGGRGQESMSERGQRGGEASMHTEKVSASELAMYLKGINFPADKQKVISAARSNNAPENVINFLNRLPSRQYSAPTEIEEEFSKIK